MKNATPSFKIGDVVRLNSGSPELVVAGLHPNGITVQWHDGADIRTAQFPEPCLRFVAKAVAKPANRA